MLTEYDVLPGDAARLCHAGQFHAVVARSSSVGLDVQRIGVNHAPDSDVYGISARVTR